MGRLHDIAVRVEAPAASEALTYNLVPVLHEVRHALERLRQSGEPTIIDLTAMPFGPGDEQGLREALGSGEVSATLEAMGETRIRETSYPGVWLVEHLSTEQRRLALHLEVAEVPFLLRTPAEDLEVAQRRLDARLGELADHPETANQ